MAILGARMLEGQKKAAEATDTAKIHRAGESSMLASMAQSISISMQKALQVFSDWAGGSGEVIFELNRDFFPANLDPGQLTALVTSWQYGAISKETPVSYTHLDVYKRQMREGFGGHVEPTRR